MPRVMGVDRFEHFFRAAAGIDIDKSDLKRYGDFVNHKIHDLLIRGEANAKANGRDIVQPQDLPITKGLQERMHEFRTLDSDVRPLLDQMIARPPLDFALSVETEARLADIGGGVSVALARSFKIIDPALKNPDSAHWERTYQVFDLLL
jgi:hypothetical protein